ncbi:MAG TPA: HlyD family secretion protein [Gemmatimonadales bacterium]|nr:HlyD family secretion protein [Gemmatimonadales bacterium]
MSTDIAIDVPATAAPEATKSGSRRLTILVAILLVLTLAGWGVRRYIFSRHHVTSDNAQVDGHITVISPRIQGFIARVLVEENQHVKAGDTLVVLDDRDVEVRLQQAEAELRDAQTAVSLRGRAGQAEAQLRATQAQAASAEAAVAAAQANFRKAAADLERYRGLAAKQIVSAQQLDAAQAAYDAANANLMAAQKQAAAAGSQVSASGAAVRGADARMAAAQAAVENAQLQLSYSALLAPVDGMVAKRTAEPGALVQVGQNLMSIVPDKDIWVTANLKETQLEHVRVGDPVEFTVDAYGDLKFQGKVESLSPATGARFALLPPDNATGNFTKVVQRVPVRIAVEQSADPAHPLRPGMSVDVTIATD